MKQPSWNLETYPESSLRIENIDLSNNDIFKTIQTYSRLINKCSLKETKKKVQIENSNSTQTPSRWIVRSWFSCQFKNARIFIPTTLLGISRKHLIRSFQLLLLCTQTPSPGTFNQVLSTSAALHTDSFTRNI
ncbi:uncharacterized protein LOC113373501 [Ctenocephalides felis]|uniref:uncharacterized protein LOC113373501 n=1 Tax=Ctenocephalides felis TaxID=7515 RepID=UPI000E6E4DA7|nr:uncharacterized protein LOC113373501 [Ctenocephalides felis]